MPRWDRVGSARFYAQSSKLDGRQDACWGVHRRVQPVLRGPRTVWQEHSGLALVGPARTRTTPHSDPFHLPSIVQPEWPIRVQDGGRSHVDDALFMASVVRREEKGSDVNVAAHLLLDVLQGQVDGALVISNDSDLRLPLVEARKRVPTGLVNPTPKPLAGDLRGSARDGVGNHWWARLAAEDLTSSQMPGAVGRARRPPHW